MICGHLCIISSLIPSSVSIIPTSTTHMEIRKSVIRICLLNQIVQHCKVKIRWTLSRWYFYNNILGFTRIHRLIISWETDVGKCKETIIGSISTISIITRFILSAKSIHICTSPSIMDYSIFIAHGCIIGS
jgi:hypothetical protein